MRRSTVVCCLAFIAWLLGALPTTAETRTVVLLYDERIDLPGLAAINASIVNTLTSGSAEPIQIFREEMDLSRFGSPQHTAIFRDYLRAKYASKKIDVAVAAFHSPLD